MPEHVRSSDLLTPERSAFVVFTSFSLQPSIGKALSAAGCLLVAGDV